MNKQRYILVIKIFILLFGKLVASEETRSKPNILLLHHDTKVLGGGEFFAVNVLQKLQNFGSNVCLLTPRDSAISKKLTKSQVAHELINNEKKGFEKIYKVCKKNETNIVITPVEYLAEVRLIAETLPIKIVVICQVSSALKRFKSYDNLKNINGFLTTSHQTFAEMIDANKKYNLNIKNIEYIAPFFDEAKFRQFSTDETRKDYFKRKFDISIEYPTIITMIGNFYKNKLYKNHALLFDAIRRLVHIKKREVHVMLAGVGPRMAEYKKLAKELDIDKYVHFLGFVTDTPGLLFHSDFHVLTSSSEAFGIVYLEAALMKKPSIGALDTGAEAVILDKKTGLLFEKDNVQNLVNCLQSMINCPLQTVKMGEAAYSFVSQSFTHEISDKKLCDFIDNVSAGTAKLSSVGILSAS